MNDDEQPTVEQPEITIRPDPLVQTVRRLAATVACLFIAVAVAIGFLWDTRSDVGDQGDVVRRLEPRITKIETRGCKPVACRRLLGDLLAVATPRQREALGLPRRAGAAPRTSGPGQPQDGTTSTGQRTRERPTSDGGRGQVRDRSPGPDGGDGDGPGPSPNPAPAPAPEAPSPPQAGPSTPPGLPPPVDEVPVPIPTPERPLVDLHVDLGLPLPPVCLGRLVALNCP